MVTPSGFAQANKIGGIYDLIQCSVLSRQSPVFSWQFKPIRFSGGSEGSDSQWFSTLPARRSRGEGGRRTTHHARRPMHHAIKSRENQRKKPE